MRKITLWFLIFVLFMQISSAALIRGSIYDISLDKRSNVIVTIDTNPKQAIIAHEGDYEFSLPVGNYTIRADYYVNKALDSTAEESIVVENEKGFYKLDIILMPAIENEIKESEINIESDDEYFKVDSNSRVFFLVIIFIVILYFFYNFKIKKRSEKLQINDKKKKRTKNKPKVSKKPKNPKHNKIKDSANDIGADYRSIVKASLEPHNISYETVHYMDEPREEVKEQKQKEDKIEEQSYHEELVKKVVAFVKDQGGSTTQKDIRKNFTSSEAKISLVLSELEHNGILQKIKKGRGNIIILKTKNKEKNFQDSYLSRQSQPLERGDKDKVHRENSENNRTG